MLAADGRRWGLAAGLITLAVAALYGRALGYPFVYDDNALVASNAALADWGTLGEALVHDLFHFASTRASPYWRPTVTFSYYLDHAVGGGAPWAFHLTNLLALAAAGLGLWRLCGVLGIAHPAALGAALLFVAHPLQVEGAANIAGRTDALACAFGLWALASRRPAAAFALTLLACGAKEIGVFVVPVAWLMGRSTWRTCALAAALFLLARQGVLSGLELLPGDRPGATLASALGAGPLTWWYLGRLVWPRWLAPAMSLESPGGFVVLGWVGLIGAGLASVAARARQPALSGGLGLTILPLMAVSGLANDALRYGETFLVVPLAGAALAGAALAVRWLPAPRAGLALAGAALLAGGIGWPRTGDWSSERALWEGAHRRLPDDPRVRQNLARTVVSEQPERALSLLEALEPGDPRQARELWEIRARAYQLRGQQAALQRALAYAIAQDPEAGWANETYCALASAEPLVQRACDWALEASPGDAALWTNAGVSRAVSGDVAGAIAYFERALALAPDNRSYRENLEHARQELRR